MGARTSVMLLIGLACTATACGRERISEPQFIRDQNLAVSLVLAISDLAEQYVDGQPVGPVDLDAACPEGGSARIRGDLGQTLQETTYDLVYELRGCAFSADYGAYRVDADIGGDLSVVGTWDRNTGFGDELMTSPLLRLTGRAVNSGSVDDFDDSCPFTFHLISNPTSDAYYGDWCERPFASSMTHRE